MSVLRWVLYDPATSESYTFRINPDEATSPRPARELSFGVSLDGRAPGFESSAPPQDWEFGGVIRTQEQHDELLYWSRKKGKLRVTDHLGQTFEIMIRAYRPTERRKTALVPWRLRYTMQTICLRRIA